MNDFEAIISIKKDFFKELDKGVIKSWEAIVESSLEYELESHSLFILKNWYEAINSLNFIQILPDGTEEIYFHTADTTEIKIKGVKRNFEHDLTQKDLETIYKIITIRHNIDWNYKNPFCSFSIRLYDQEFRISLIHHSITTTGKPKGFFRILNNQAISISFYKADEELKKMIINKKNILIAGPTGSGKTTLTNSLLSLIPKEEHVLILEDTKELLHLGENTTSLISSERFNQSLDSLLTYGLRISPERVVLGEMRSKEVTSFLLAMNTGHKGMISTIHANSALDTLHRAALMFMMYGNMNLSYELVLKLICQNIDHIIYIENKEIKDIIEVYGAEGNTIFFDSILKNEVNSLSNLQI